ncbi:hypothetical protein GWC77_26555 [Paraburkholderia sp. NMBU_R16]|uniref:response regulator transcription factor n=1 Tax=Paraburkholderia sp. NMBU_R16 TaxID=2698676 RepID=UPI00156607C5|nr:winged helix-turn-helix domain-containing protein [Paraburkholderia sp. NMBU_R16]NRO99446.1 hypothetical protein [Paraburkholderia sp. NMBU_R16]
MTRIAICSASQLFKDDLRKKLVHTCVDVSCFDCEATLIHAVDRFDYGLAFVDYSLGVESILAICFRCAQPPRCPVTIVLPCGVEQEAVMRIIDTGADHILTAPVDAIEVSWHVMLAQTRGLETSTRGNTRRLGGYVLDRAGQTVEIGNLRIPLTPREFSLAWLLFSYGPRGIVRRNIALCVWGKDELIVGHTLDQHVYQLRKKLFLNGEYGVTLRATYGHGYRLDLQNGSSRLLPIEVTDEQELGLHRPSPCIAEAH